MKKLWSIVFLLFFVSSVFAMGEQPEGIKQAPDFSLPDLTGKQVKLSTFRGQTVFLNFWATWCPPCRSELPSIQALHQAMKGKKFVVITIATDWRGRAAVQPVVNDNKLDFIVLLDPAGQVSDQYGVGAFPTTFIINPQGQIINKYLGARDWLKELSND